MPQNLVSRSVFVVGMAALAGCVFDSELRGGTYRCSDGVCPADLVCDADQRCVSAPPVDALVADGPDAPLDAPADARLAALTCADPGLLPAAGGSASGTTVGRSSLVSASCGGFILNGADAVHRIPVAVGERVLVSVTGLKAYVLVTCTPSPGTPLCVGNALAAPGDPLQTAPAAANGAYFIVVDHEAPATTGPYTLDVTKP